MITLRQGILLFAFLHALLWMASCQQASEAREQPPAIDKLPTGEFMRKNLRFLLQQHTTNESTDSLRSSLFMYKPLQAFYQSKNFEPVWVDTGYWTRPALQLMAYIDTAAFDGLFPEDYHQDRLTSLKTLFAKDSLGRINGALWTEAEMMLTDAAMRIVYDLKQGRLKPDSLHWRHDSSRYLSFFAKHVSGILETGDVNLYMGSLQPQWPVYREIRRAIPDFLTSMDTTQYSYIPFPYQKSDSTDSIRFVRNLRLRLIEEGYAALSKKPLPDSQQLAMVLSDYQKKKNLVVDGKAGPSVVRSLNMTDRMKRAFIAISLDKIKELPDSVPDTYVWVNLPSFQLQAWEMDTLSFVSRIIVGKPVTPTPEITSKISDLVIYPTWTVPPGIIQKEMLPGLKRNPGYLARKGLNLYNHKGESVDPASIDWSKYKKAIPFKIQQGSGDDNALGVIKFNFDNPHFVYLHDTNQRYLFKNKQRALSHGCVRVQEWSALAALISRNDSLRLKPGDSLRFTTDSVHHWIAAKQKNRVLVKHPVPLFIRYLSCEGRDGQMIFYDDIYQVDKKLKERFFATR